MNRQNSVIQIGHYNLDLYRSSFANDKVFRSFVKKCLSIIRMSPEYRDWSEYIKDTLGYKTCVFTQETADELTIEIHHHPMTLYDITEAEINRCLTLGEEFCSMDIVKNVMLLHYSDNIGYLPIVSSLHEKYHNGYLVIPPKFVNGNWTYLVDHDDYILDDGLILKIQDLMKEDNNKYDQYDNWQNPGGIIKHG